MMLNPLAFYEELRAIPERMIDNLIVQGVDPLVICDCDHHAQHAGCSPVPLNSVLSPAGSIA